MQKHSGILATGLLAAALLADPAPTPARQPAQQPVPQPASPAASPQPLAAPEAPSASASTNQATAESEPAPAADTVMRQTVRNVLVDVTVTDRSGHPITGLGKEHFQLIENGVPQTVSFLEEHRATPPPDAKPMALPPGVYSNVSAPQSNGALMVLLLDSLNTQIADQATVHKMLVDYLKREPAGARIAIFTLGSRLNILQGFTTDPSLLQAALAKLKSLPKPSAVLRSEGMPSETDILNDSIASSGGSSAGLGSSMTSSYATLMAFLGEEEQFRLDLRIKMTQDAFTALGKYLAGFPGRKNLIWFSGAFPSGILPNGAGGELPGGPGDMGAVRNYDEDQMRIADLLAQARVSVYPVDARGVIVAPNTTAALMNSKYGRQNTSPTPGSSPSEYANDINTFSRQTVAEHTTMDNLAEATGGRALYGSNDIADAVRQVAQVAGNYYSLAYSPINKKYDGSFRKVQIKLDIRGAKIDYRHGYFADSPSAGPLVNVRPVNPVAAMMQRAAPDQTQLAFKVRILPLDAQPDLSVAANRAGDRAQSLKGPLTRYGIDWAASMRGLRLVRSADGHVHGRVTLLAVAYDVDGQVLNSVGGDLLLNLTAEEFQTDFAQGLHYRNVIDLPKGEVYLRVGILNPESGLAGATEVPLQVNPKITQANPDSSKQATAKPSTP